MAARKTTKTATTASEGIEMILATEPLKTINEAAEYVGVASVRLLELLAETLKKPEAMGWDTLPIEHTHLLNEFKAQVNGTQALPETPQETSEPELTQPEPPAVEQEPDAPKAKKSSRKSSALTKGKADKIQETKEETKETSVGINETLTLLQAQEAKVDSSHDATAYLATYATNLTNLKGEGLAYFAAQSLQKISNSSGFNPQEIMKQVGVTLSAETQAKLNETMGQVLGKSHAAAQEIQETAWGNGYNLQAELLNLENLMNSED